MICYHMTQWHAVIVYDQSIPWWAKNTLSCLKADDQWCQCSDWKPCHHGWILHEHLRELLSSLVWISHPRGWASFFGQIDWSTRASTQSDRLTRDDYHLHIISSVEPRPNNAIDRSAEAIMKVTDQRLSNKTLLARISCNLKSTEEDSVHCLVLTNAVNKQLESGLKRATNLKCFRVNENTFCM